VINAEQEALWREELKQARTRLIERVREASKFSSPTRRYALYQEWRKELGDDVARESAKYTEGVIEGRVTLYHLEKMTG
jgi:hypothetical protein